MKTTVPTKTYNQKQNPMNTNTDPVHQPTMFTSDVAFPQAAGISRKAFIGIDNGFTGGIACLLPDGNVLTRPVSVIDLGKERLLDLDRNRDRRFRSRTGGDLQIGLRPRNLKDAVGRGGP